LVIVDFGWLVHFAAFFARVEAGLFLIFAVVDERSKPREEEA